ncbi:hypothetical protein N9B94_04455, partial [Verrucomicrobia bacterium]|nr:hypothetical protein [Verrucomicrobiota bacterium]
MNTPPHHPSAAKTFFTLLLLLLQQTLTAAEHTPEPYTQAIDEDKNTRALQTAVRKFVKKGAPDIYLTGAAHLGSKEYFTTLQEHLAEMSIVLYEGVGDVPDKANDKERIGSVQSVLAESLQLQFQLDAIDYNKVNFTNSDMSMEQLGHLMSGGDIEDLPPRKRQRKKVPSIPEDTTNDQPKVIKLHENDPDTNPEFDRLLQIMDGTTAMGAMVDVMVRFIGSSPKLQALTRLMFVELLGGLKGDLSQSPAMTPQMKDMIHVLIRSRNQLVLQDLRKALKDPSNKSISIFYGAGHMDDLEKRIVEKMGYQPTET